MINNFILTSGGKERGNLNCNSNEGWCTEKSGVNYSKKKWPWKVTKSFTSHLSPP